MKQKRYTEEHLIHDINISISPVSSYTSQAVTHIVLLLIFSAQCFSLFVKS